MPEPKETKLLTVAAISIQEGKSPGFKAEEDGEWYNRSKPEWYRGIPFHELEVGDKVSCKVGFGKDGRRYIGAMNKLESGATVGNGKPAPSQRSEEIVRQSSMKVAVELVSAGREGELPLVVDVAESIADWVFERREYAKGEEEPSDEDDPFHQE